MRTAKSTPDIPTAGFQIRVRNVFLEIGVPALVGNSRESRSIPLRGDVLGDGVEPLLSDADRSGLVVLWVGLDHHALAGGRVLVQRCRITLDRNGRLWNPKSASDLRVYRGSSASDSPANVFRVLLITQRSQVHILPPLQSKTAGQRPFAKVGEGPSACRDRPVTADLAARNCASPAHA
jgi:hypothetical protein